MRSSPEARETGIADPGPDKSPGMAVRDGVRASGEGVDRGAAQGAGAQSPFLTAADSSLSQQEQGYCAPPLFLERYLSCSVCWP